MSKIHTNNTFPILLSYTFKVLIQFYIKFSQMLAEISFEIEALLKISKDLKCIYYNKNFHFLVLLEYIHGNL